MPPAPKTTSTEKGNAGDYIDFRTDGMAYIKDPAEEYRLPYTIIDDTQIQIGDLVYVIEQFTEKVLVLHHTNVFSSGGSTEDIVYLNR